MVEMLKRLSNAMDFDDYLSDFDNETVSKTVDEIDSLNISELESLLTKDELQRFKKILDSTPALDAIIEIWTPWWTNDVANAPEVIQHKEFVPKVLELPLSLIDFCISYIAMMRIFNGDTTDCQQCYLLFKEISFVFSNAKPTFVFNSTKQVLELLRAQLLSHPSKVDAACLDLFYNDLNLVFRDANHIKSVLSDMSRICHNVYKKFKLTESIQIAKKLEYFVGLCWNMEETRIELELYASAFVRKDPSPLQRSQGLIEEIEE